MGVDGGEGDLSRGVPGRDIAGVDKISSLFSYLPPSTTLRRYIRMTHSTTVAEIGQLYCDIISYAHANSHTEIDDIPKKLIAIRLKLKRTTAMKANVVYEVHY